MTAWSPAAQQCGASSHEMKTALQPQQAASQLSEARQVISPSAWGQPMGDPKAAPSAWKAAASQEATRERQLSPASSQGSTSFALGNVSEDRVQGHKPFPGQKVTEVTGMHNSERARGSSSPKKGRQASRSANWKETSGGRPPR